MRAFRGEPLQRGPDDGDAELRERAGHALVEIARARLQQGPEKLGTCRPGGRRREPLRFRRTRSFFRRAFESASGGFAKPIAIKSPKQDQFEPALLLPDMPTLKQAASIIAGCGSYGPARVLEVDQAGKISKILLTKLIDRTGSFARRLEQDAQVVVRGGRVR